MEFEAAAPEGLAGVSLTGLVGASSILEGLNQAVDAVVPLLSRFGSVEGAEDLIDNLGQGSILFQAVDLRSLACNVHFTLGLGHLVLLEGLLQLEHLGGNIVQGCVAPLVELLVVMLAMVIVSVPVVSVVVVVAGAELAAVDDNKAGQNGDQQEGKGALDVHAGVVEKAIDESGLSVDV